MSSNVEERLLNRIDQLEARLAEAERINKIAMEIVGDLRLEHRKFDTAMIKFLGSANESLIADYDALAARLAEAERLLREAMKWWDYGASWPGSEYRASGLNERIYAFLGATDSADARCFRCGHAAHNGDCVNVAPCGECGATDRHYSGCTHAYQRVALTVSASSAEALGVKP